MKIHREDKKNVLFWIAVNSKDPLLQEKHGGFEYFKFSRYTWEWWCKKNDVIFFPYETPGESDTNKHKITWQRWFDVFDQLEEAGINYDKICVMDSCAMVKWDTPNFFNFTYAQVTAFRSLENLRWIAEGVDGYNNFFNGFEFDLKKYISCGFQIFEESHREFLKELKEFYYENYDGIMDLQNNKVKRGTDQPVYNYMLQMKNVQVDKKLSPPYMMTHMMRFDWFGRNWQLDDNTPHFIRYGYVWFYSGFPNRGDRYQLMEQTWNMVKENYK
jgi:hypothetical protein|tara:strand:- start:537 stop:1352 length:816 start_codon:yes stop_codon:yes gene_type:complete